MAGLGKPEAGLGEISGFAFSADVLYFGIAILLQFRNLQRCSWYMGVQTQFSQ